WTQYATGKNWGSAGATGSADRGTSVLGSVTGSRSGFITVPLTAAGVALVQAWVNSASANHGLILANPTNSDGLAFPSREATTAAERPKLTVTYASAAVSSAAAPSARASTASGGSNTSSP